MAYLEFFERGGGSTDMVSLIFGEGVGAELTLIKAL